MFFVVPEICGKILTVDSVKLNEIKAYWDSALPMSEWWERMQSQPMDAASPHHEYLRVNRQRVRRIQKSLVLTPEIKTAASAVSLGSKWLILNEHWCGDGAQILPVLDAVGQASSGHLSVRVLYRDQNLGLMDRFLTDGGRSIPKTIALNADFDVVADWGPRPMKAMNLVRAWKADPEEAPHYARHLHKWYARDRQVSIQAEILTHLLQPLVS